MGAGSGSEAALRTLNGYKPCRVPVHIAGRSQLGREVVDALVRGQSGDRRTGSRRRSRLDDRDSRDVRPAAQGSRRRRVRCLCHGSRCSPSTLLPHGTVWQRAGQFGAPTATVAYEAVVRPGCVVLANASVSTGVHLKPHSRGHYNAITWHNSLFRRAHWRAFRAIPLRVEGSGWNDRQQRMLAETVVRVWFRLPRSRRCRHKSRFYRVGTTWLQVCCSSTGEPSGVVLPFSENEYFRPSLRR